MPDKVVLSSNLNWLIGYAIPTTQLRPYSWLPNPTPMKGVHVNL